MENIVKFSIGGTLVDIHFVAEKDAEQMSEILSERTDKAYKHGYDDAMADYLRVKEAIERVKDEI